MRGRLSPAPHVVERSSAGVHGVPLLIQNTFMNSSKITCDRSDVGEFDE